MKHRVMKSGSSRRAAGWLRHRGTRNRLGAGALFHDGGLVAKNRQSASSAVDARPIEPKRVTVSSRHDAEKANEPLEIVVRHHQLDHEHQSVDDEPGCDKRVS